MPSGLYFCSLTTVCNALDRQKEKKINLDFMELKKSFQMEQEIYSEQFSLFLCCISGFSHLRVCVHDSANLQPTKTTKLGESLIPTETQNIPASNQNTAVQQSTGNTRSRCEGAPAGEECTAVHRSRLTRFV